MEKYNYQTRKILHDEYKNKFYKKSLFHILFTDMNTKNIVSEIEQFSSYSSSSTPNITRACRRMEEENYNLPSVFMQKEYQKLVEFYTTKDNRGGFYYIIDKFNQFTYSKSICRRSVKSSKYGPWMERVFRLLHDYYLFGFYECSVSQYLRNEMSEEKLDYKQNQFYHSDMQHFDDMIAACIDLGDDDLKNTIKEIILSENNTSVVTTEMILGIIKSSDEGLHKLLGDFLLAARLQEGIRQAICENMDCGTKEAFLLLFNVICDNNLIRFSSVKRAISTWVGICDESNMDRITGKMLLLMKECLNSRQKTIEYTKSNDSIEIMIALWTLGFYEVSDVIEIMKGFVVEGTKNQKLTMSYYNRALEDDEFSGIVSKKMLEEYSRDFEMVAAFIPTYLEQTDSYAYQITEKDTKKTKSYKKVPITYLFCDKEEAIKHFYILKEIYEAMPTKRMEYNPCIFPWYSISLSKTQLVKRMCLIAYSLGDNAIIDYAAAQISNIDISEGYSNRSQYLEILLHNPKTEVQKELLVNYIADKESMTRTTAFNLVKKVTLEEKYYQNIERMLKYKAGDIRKNVIELLSIQDNVSLLSSISRLLKEDKEEIRIGGLDIVLQLKRDKKRSQVYENCIKLVEDIDNPTSKEKILIDEICGASKASEILNQKGYGLYDPMVQFELSLPPHDETLLKNYFDIPSENLNNIIDKLEAFIQKHELMEYKDAYGEERLLGNGLRFTTYGDGIPYEDAMPFKHLWCEFYQNEIKDFKTLINLYLTVNKGINYTKNPNALKKYEELILGRYIMQTVFVESEYDFSSDFDIRSIIPDVLKILVHIYKEKNQERELAKAAFLYIIEKFPDKALWYKTKEEHFMSDTHISFMHTGEMGIFKNYLDDWDTPEEFKERFILFKKLDEKFSKSSSEQHVECHYSIDDEKFLNILDYLKAYVLGCVSTDTVYKAIFEDIGIYDSLIMLSYFYKDKLRQHENSILRKYGLEDGNTTSSFYQKGCFFYKTVVDKILDVELKRGDTPTVFSSSIHGISSIYGVERLVEILVAIGKDTLDRSTFYWSRSDTRKSCLSYLLKVCYPMKEDNANKLSKLIKGTGIKEQRLIETAMYAPQWMDIIGEYLGIIGLKSGCYYFMAHMNESFDDKKQAMIAKYTPITPEALNNGAFDLNWFKEAYELLGEKNFTIIYDAAKYISDGSKHARARKYADAALGKVTVPELETTITDKRNKDLLMSYGLIPVQNKNDLLHRYEFLQKFLKESKQFGTQRKASEASAVEIVMENLALAAGFTDVTRLVLMMETELIKSFAPLMDWKDIEGFDLCLKVDELGQAHIEIMKKDKLLSTLPAALKNNEYVTELKATQKKLKDQYLRTKKMFEDAMENEVIFTAVELLELCENPVVNPIVSPLVYINEEMDAIKIGFLSDSGLISYTGEVQTISPEALIRIAHPYDLYKARCWHSYQKYLFDEVKADRRKKQPFKQVFRELYIKTEEELDKKKSLMFAGNQIQPQKTVGCLKTRKWIADYEEGLQKVYYKENIVARIYAMADWFSPSDVEAPTLEWVEFSNRKTFDTLTIKEIPEIIFSEVMRDVDLAVSVAHVGGVDPESSHSTVEMRKTVIEFNLPLFGLDNVTLDGSHAIIKGKRSEYSVHLGSGIIHKIGGPMINVLPVHSQSRGKLFLPFIDEDPKTAEIMSKIVLFARDETIKDPYILKQFS